MKGKNIAALIAPAHGGDPYCDYLRGKGLLEKFQADYRENRLGNQHLEGRASVLAEPDSQDSYIGRHTAEWISRYDGDKPFFLWVDFSAPHPPADAPEPYASMYQAKDMREPVGFPTDDRKLVRGLTLERAKQFRAGYYAMITHLDDQVGRIVEALERTGRLDNTVIVFFGDHGSMCGDLGLFGKSNFYRGAVSSPLLIAGSGFVAGQRIDRVVELVDVAPTALELADVPAADRRESYGHSLLPLLTGRGEYQRTAAFSEMTDAKMVTDGRYKFANGEAPMLFDLQNDPHPRAQQPGRPGAGGRSADAEAHRPVAGNDRPGACPQSHAAARPITEPVLIRMVRWRAVVARTVTKQAAMRRAADALAAGPEYSQGRGFVTRESATPLAGRATPAARGASAAGGLVSGGRPAGGTAR